MKCNILLLSLLLIAATASAQEETMAPPKANAVTWNVLGGLNFSYFQSAENTRSNTKVGYHVGVGMECAIDSTWVFQPSLLLTTKGGKSTLDGGLSENLNAMYIELPLLVGAVSYIKGHKLVAALGPFIAYGVGGQYVVSDGSASISLDAFGKSTYQTIESDGLKRFDAGLVACFTFEFGRQNNLIATLSAEYGFVNLATVQGAKLTNRSLSLGLGYKF
jgi:hypothetical protein